MLLCARRQVGGLLLAARNTLIALALLPIVGHLQAGGTMPAASAAAHGVWFSVGVRCSPRTGYFIWSSHNDLTNDNR